MRIFQLMRSGRMRRRWSRESRVETSYERASIQLRVLVAMAAADDEIRATELEHLTAIADRLATRHTKDRVHALLHMLIKAPPSEEDALRALLAAPGYKGLTRSLLDDISAIARADDHVDVREERLVNLLSAVGGGMPVSLRHRFGVPLRHEDQQLLDRLRSEVDAERSRRNAA